MQNEPPFILDRFRNMAKEREEELSFSSYAGDGVDSSLSTDEIVRLYEIVLSELTFNSKPIITDLTIIAGEQRVHGDGIADGICARILEVPAEQKLPSLYLLDSIAKNIGGEYVKYFSARLPQVFHEAYAQVHPNMHPVMRRLFDTWTNVFPASVLSKIDAQLRIAPSAKHKSPDLTLLRASESPQPAHGIQVNPKYLESQNQFRGSTVDTVGAERLSSSPYGIGHDRSLSPSLDEYVANSLRRQPAERASPSHSGFGYETGRVMARDQNASEWRGRNWDSASGHQLKISVVRSSSNGVDLRGPRALIDAYGIDERETKFNLGHPKVEHLDVSGVDQKASIKSWRNTEEEEFEWEDMSPTLGDKRRNNKLNSSYFPLHGNLTARHKFATHNAAEFATHSRSSWSKTQFPSAIDSCIVEDVSHSSGHGIVNKITGFREPRSQIATSSSGRESWNLPHNLSSEGDGNIFGPPDVPTIGVMYDSQSSEIPSADAPALTEEWLPSKLQSSYPLPLLVSLPSQMQMRGQFNTTDSGSVFTDKGLNKSIHSKQSLGGTSTLLNGELPQFPVWLPGLVPLNFQSSAQSARVLPHLFTSQGVRQNSSLPFLAPTLSHATVQPPSRGYATQGHAPPSSSALQNIVSVVQSSLPFSDAPNASFHSPQLPQGLLLGAKQLVPTPQNIGQVSTNPPSGGALSGLISSLVARGLISLTKQDNIGVKFDQDLLKGRHESAITTLYADLPRQCAACGLRFKSQEEHSKHMDWHVNKNRALRNRKTKPSPSWFVSINMWLHGAEALGTEAVPGFLPAENIVEKKYEEMAVPADENQTDCALCGEPFEDFYSDEMDEWMYKGTVYMNSPEGSSEGMSWSQLGPIVHAKCRSDSHAIPAEDVTKDERELSEEGIQRKRMRS